MICRQFTNGGFGMAGPGQPAGQGVLAGFPFEAEHVTQPFFEEVGAIEGRMGFRDPGELGCLADGQVIGVLPQRVAGTVEALGVPEGTREPPASVRDVSVAPGLAGGAPTGGGPHRGLLWPRRRRGTGQRTGTACGAARGGGLGDPVRAVGGKMGDQGGALFAEKIEEGARFPVRGRGRPRSASAAVMVNDDGEIPVALFRRSRRSRSAAPANGQCAASASATRATIQLRCARRPASAV